jgi:hypothetical protein
MRIILLGPPGGGKGTQGGLIEAAWGFPRISTGDLLRRAVRDRTPLGLKAEDRMNSGELVEDELVLELVRERIARGDCADGYVLDGFPRTVPQAEGLEALDADVRKSLWILRWMKRPWSIGSRAALSARSAMPSSIRPSRNRNSPEPAMSAGRNSSVDRMMPLRLWPRGSKSTETASSLSWPIIGIGTP